jgi:hypothetical protein
MNQTARHETHTVENIIGGPNLPSECGYLQRTHIGEVKHQFGFFCNKCGRTIIERIQRHLCVDVQGPKRHSTSPSTTSN